MDCGIAREDAPHQHISTRGLCGNCALRRRLENNDSIAARQGIPYERWRLGIAISVLPTEVVGALYAAGEFGKTAA
jgi:hypothetical protein